MARMLMDDEADVVEYLKGLISKGEEFYSVKFHPGKSDDFETWKEEISTFVARRYGISAPVWGKVNSVECFPQWFDEKVHAPKGSYVSTDAQDHDRETALKIYFDGIRAYLAILKSLVKDIEVNGLPKEPTAAVRDSNLTANFNPVFSQSQEQHQSQEQAVKIEDQINLLIEFVEKKYGEDEATKAKELLDALKIDNKWATVQKVSAFFLNLGRDAFIALLPLLTQILLNQK